MNYRKGILINTVLLILLSLSALVVYSPAPSPDLIQKEERIPLLNYNVADISIVALIHGETRFGLIHKDGRISLEPPPGETALSKQRLQSFLYRLSKLTALSRIESSPGEYEQFGLDHPEVFTTVILGNGEKLHLSLGKQNSLNGTYYLHREGEDALYVISEEDAALFLSEPSDFTVKQVLPQVELEELDTIEYIQLSSKSSRFRIENRGDFVFSLNLPIQNSVDYEKTLSDLIFPLLSLAPDRQAARDTELPPRADILINMGIAGSDYKLSFYRQQNGSYLLTSSAYPGVYLLEEDLPFTRLEYRDLLNDSIYHSNISEIQGVAIQDLISGRDYNIELSGESVNLKGLINEMPLDYPVLMDFFQILLKTGIARELNEVKTLERNDSEAMSIQIYKKNGSIDRLDYLPDREGEQILFINGTANYATYNKTILDIQNALTDLIGKEGA